MSQELASKMEGAEASGGAAMRWLLPSVGALLFVVLLFSLTSGRLASRLLRDGGTGWHIRTGQIILATHSIPRTDPFSATMRGHTWYAWEWLYDAKLGAVYNWAGLNGAVAWTGIIVAATFLLLLQMMRRRGTDLLTSIVLFLMALAVAMIHLFVRPHVVSWLLALVFWVVLERARRLDAPLRLWWLPLLMVVWVNVHGGFLVGLALIGIYWLVQ